MKPLIIALSILLAIIILITVHSILMFNLAEDIGQACHSVTDFANKGQWDQVTTEIDNIKSIWDKYRTWVSLTISTQEIEQIEIALKQSRAYAELKQKTDFMGEFIMFSMLVDHIPHQEGFHIAEIL